MMKTTRSMKALNKSSDLLATGEVINLEGEFKKMSDRFLKYFDKKLEELRRDLGMRPADEKDFRDRLARKNVLRENSV